MLGCDTGRPDEEPRQFLRCIQEQLVSRIDRGKEPAGDGGLRRRFSEIDYLEVDLP